MKEDDDETSQSSPPDISSTTPAATPKTDHIDEAGKDDNAEASFLSITFFWHYWLKLAFNWPKEYSPKIFAKVYWPMRLPEIDPVLDN